jgi:hypothetical protein
MARCVLPGSLEWKEGMHPAMNVQMGRIGWLPKEGKEIAADFRLFCRRASSVSNLLPITPLRSPQRRDDVQPPKVRRL